MSTNKLSLEEFLINRRSLKKQLFDAIQNRNGALERFKALLDQGADPEWTNEGDTALLAAIRAKRLDFAEELFKRNVEFLITNLYYGETSLNLAIRSGLPDIVKKLLAYQGDPAFWDMDMEWNEQPVKTAVRYDRLECLKLLVDAGFALNETEYDGQTFLHFAAAENSASCIDYLLDLGADIEARDSSLKTPLFRAVERDGFDAAKTLIRRGASPFVKDLYGASLLDKATDQSICSLVEHAMLAWRASSKSEAGYSAEPAGMGL